MNNLKIFFPKTNPIVFDKRGTYHSYQDAIIHEATRDFIQQFAETDRVAFQITWDSLTWCSFPKFEVILNINGEDVLFKEITASDTSGGDFPAFFYKRTKPTGKNLGGGVFGFSYILKDIKNETQLINNGDCFYFKIKIEDSTFESNKLICDNNTERTKLIKYFQSTREGEISYGTHFYVMPQGYNIRLQAEFTEIQPKASKEVFQTYKGDFELVSAMPYKVEILQIGNRNGTGLPDWFVENLNFIFHLDNKYIDGVSYELTDNSDFNLDRVLKYNNRFLQLELCKKEQEGFLIGSGYLRIFHDPTTPTSGKIDVITNGNYYLQGGLEIDMSEFIVTGNSTVTYELGANHTDEPITIIVDVLDLETDLKVDEVEIVIPPANEGLCYEELCTELYLTCEDYE